MITGTTRGLALVFFAVLAASCGAEPPGPAKPSQAIELPQTTAGGVKVNVKATVHVFVALCDNKNQGIVPVPATLGNGDDPDNNLYWGAAYGVKTFFRKSPDWEIISAERKEGGPVVERVVFRRRGRDAWLVADAYRGSEIKAAVQHFLESCAGRRDEQVKLGDAVLLLGGSARLRAYVGHNGLMDFSPAEFPRKADACARDALVLCCKSRAYFGAPLAGAGARPLLLTNGLMAPEAYVLEAALAGWLAGEGREKIARRAAEAYDRFQKCGPAAARALFAEP